jgi:hypothetical protein
MKLLNDIIELLSSQKGSLTDALLKTKILLHKIGHQELIQWTNNELNGYPDRDSVPPYRVLQGQVLANVASMVYQFNAHPIPLGHLDRGVREKFQTARMDQSVAVLEKFIEKSNTHVQAPIPMEANYILSKSLESGYGIQRAWCEISKTDITQILVQVRSRLLDFVLELSQQLKEDDLTDDEIKQRGRDIDAVGLFNHAIFGDNVTIMVGDGNRQTVTNINVPGDASALFALLRSHNVPEEDVLDLQQAIEADENQIDPKAKKFGPAVKRWLEKMWSKAVDASWQIELGIAGNILADALMRYYGWK